MDGKHLIALGAGVSPFAAGGGAVVPTFCSCVERIPFDVINSYYVATKSVIFWGGGSCCYYSSSIPFITHDEHIGSES